MKNQYVFDSNIFIGLQRRQPLDVYPSVWAKIGELMKNGTIISSREVYDEIVVGNDEVSKWVKGKEESFIKSGIEVQKKVREILKNYRQLVEGGKKNNNADPFVIAVAQIYQCTVVTEETPTNNQLSPHISDVCKSLAIDYTDFVGFSRRMQLEF